MPVPFKSVALGVIALLGVAGGVWSAEDAANPPPSSEAAAALVAPEFVKHLDVDAAVAAFRADDADALLALGEKLSLAERTVGKPNAPLPASTFYLITIHIARNNHDLKRLDQLEALIGGAKQISESDKKLLLAEIALARKFSAGARKVDAGPGLKPSEVTAEAIALYHTFVREIRITQEYGSEDELTQLVDGIKQLRELHPKQRDHLAKMATTAKVAIRERTNADPVLVMLASVSRNTDSGLRILGPAQVPLDGAVSLVVIATNPEGRKPGQLHLRSSAGVKVPASLAWSGTPLVIPATIKAGTGARVFVSAGLNDKSNLMTWNAQTVRE